MTKGFGTTTTAPRPTRPRRKSSSLNAAQQITQQPRRYRIPMNQLTADLQQRLGRGLLVVERGYPAFYWHRDRLPIGSAVTELVNQYDPTQQFILLDVGTGQPTALAFLETPGYILSDRPLADTVAMLADHSNAIASNAVRRWSLEVA